MTILTQVIPVVIASTSRWMVVSKPSGWLTIPPTPVKPGLESTESFPVLVDWLRKQRDPIWIVHRLDVQTSGVVLFAKSAADHRQANEWFQQRRMKKTYAFLAHGDPQLPMMKCQELIHGKPALTQVEVKEVFDSAFYGYAVPKTGRRHQIRIHLAHRGFPILGDPHYGGPVQVGSLTVGRVALHAMRLQLPTGELFESNLPEDFLAWLGHLRHSTKKDFQ